MYNKRKQNGKRLGTESRMKIKRRNRIWIKKRRAKKIWRGYKSRFCRQPLSIFSFSWLEWLEIPRLVWSWSSIQWWKHTLGTQNMGNVLFLFRSMYLINLAVSDLVTLCVGLPFEVMMNWNQYPWPFPDYVCNLKALIAETTRYVTLVI